MKDFFKYVLKDFLILIAGIIIAIGGVLICWANLDWEQPESLFLYIFGLLITIGGALIISRTLLKFI